MCCDYVRLGSFLSVTIKTGFVALFSVVVLLTCLELSAAAQTNPAPLVNQPLVPASIAPGGPGFALIVNGSGFVSGSEVNWNGTSRPTSFVSSSQLKATISSG